jgi:hypothetical protein
MAHISWVSSSITKCPDLAKSASIRAQILVFRFLLGFWRKYDEQRREMMELLTEYLNL